VAYVVCAGLGIDSAGYSLPYVASWSGGDVDKVTATANRVIGCARDVLGGLEPVRGLEPDPPPVDRTPRLETANREPAAPTRGPSDSSVLAEVLTAATSVYQRLLREPEGAPALEYLRQRGIGDEAVTRWRLGYATGSWETVSNTLRDEGFTDEILVASGVVARARTGRLYDRMRGRLVFPIHDAAGAPRGFAGRAIVGDGPKYLNTPETDLYQKRTLLYGMHLAHEAITDTGKAIVVEGYTDVIAAHQAGIGNVVATSGTALTPQHLETLEKIATDVTLAFDGDQAGRTAAQRTGDLDHTNRNMQFSVARLPNGQDPADLLAAGDRRLLREAIADAVPLAHHLIDQILSQHNLDEPEAMVRAIRTAGAVVPPITDPAVRAQAVSYLATRIGRDEALIQQCIQDRTPRPGLQRRRDTGRSLG
jgi:DNA primase